MSRLEELPDDFDESLNINDAPSQVTRKSLGDLVGRRLDTADGFSNKTFDEITQEMSKTPIFMNELDVAESIQDNEQNDLLEAIKAIQYEGTKSEVIQGFKDQGNEMVKVKRWKDAKEFYSKGVLVWTSKLDGKCDKPDDEDDERVKLKIVEEQIYVNRALCNLELKNYRSATLDCSAALKVNPNNVKAHYRSALALLALDKVPEALDVCYRGIKLDEANAPMQKLLERIQSRAAVVEQQMRKRKAEQHRKIQEKRMLETALTARKIQVRGSKHPPDLEDSEIRLSPDPLSLNSLLEFPMMLLYPLHSQSDFIKAAAENRSLSDHLSYILPLPWDEKGEYKAASVDCYMDTMSGGMVKVGKKLTLLEVLSNGKTEVVDSLVRVHVVPTSLAPEWLTEVKRKKSK